MTIKMTLSQDHFGDAESEESRINVFVKQMLVTKIFAATYTARNYVDSLKDYRDVLKIKKEEIELIRDLEVVKKRVNNFYKGAIWAAITGPEDTDSEALAGHCLWTKLENVAFGCYWFMIQNVYFSQQGELVLTVKVVRKYEPEIQTEANILDCSMNWDEIKANLISNAQQFGAAVATNMRELLTWHNIKESSRFIFLLLMAVGTALMYGLQYLGDYSIKFFREFNNFIKVMTPIFIAIIDMVTKLIGGFYLLLAMLWRGNSPGPMPHFPSLMAAPMPGKQFKQGYQQRRSPSGYSNNYY